MARKRAARQADNTRAHSRRYEDRVSDEAQLMWTFFVALAMAAAALLKLGTPGTGLLEATAESEIASLQPSTSQMSAPQPGRTPAGKILPKP